MKAVFRMIFAFVMIAGAPLLAAASVLPISFEALVKQSNYIVVGKVQSKMYVERIKVAKIEVIRTLKGSPEKEFYYLARPTWTCDITTASVGETALFFFMKYQFVDNPKPRPIPDANGFVTLSSDFEEPLGFAENLEVITKGTPFLRVTDAGRGRMPFRKIDDVEYVDVWIGDVRLPKEVTTVTGPEPQYDFIRSARLDQILESVEKILQQPNAKP